MIFSAKTSDRSRPITRMIAFWAPPLIALVFFVVLLTLGISGTSSGMNWYFIHGGPDPRLLSGLPRTIRSDEWMVQQSWVVSQWIQGFPISNVHFPGGIDMTVFNDLPVWDWSTIFRPHTWGYLVLGIANGIAWYWWFPALAVFVSGYLLVVSLLPRNIVLGILLPVITLLSPFVQWWYQPTTLWAFAWTYTAITCFLWVIKSSSKKIRLICSVIFAYISILFAFEIYVPFIVPAILIFVSTGIGILLEVPKEQLNVKQRITNLARKIMPLVISASAALVIISFWVFTRLNTLQLILNTVYPGQRNIATGQGLFDPNANYVSLFSGIWSNALKGTDLPTVLGTNPSEASSSLPIVVLMIPVSVGLVAYVYLKFNKIDWPLFLNLTVTVIFLAFLYVPGWDFISKLFLLDLVPPARLKIGLAIQIPITLVLIVRTLSAKNSRIQYWCAITTAVISLAVITPIVISFHEKPETWMQMGSVWKLALPLFVIGLSIFLIQKFRYLGLSLLFISSMLVSWGVNPIYVGTYNLYETKVAKTIDDINLTSPGIWVGIGGYSPDVLLTQSAVQSYSGVQNYPIYGIWNEIDPNHVFETKWNRLGHIRWDISQESFSIANPQPDVIEVKWNPCKLDKRINVKYLLSDSIIPEGFECLTLITSVPEGQSTFYIYKTT